VASRTPGGAVTIKRRPVLINGTVFLSNTASESGGALYVVQEQSEGGGFVQLTSCLLHKNKVGAGRDSSTADTKH
jgi:predicted outer membrane repeat protein